MAKKRAATRTPRTAPDGKKRPPERGASQIEAAPLADPEVLPPSDAGSDANPIPHRGLVFEERTPEYLIPRAGSETPASVSYFQNVVMTKYGAQDPAATEIDGPLTLSGLDLNATSPAEGLVITHQQSWTLQSLALGNVLHSLCLAPGEVTRVAMVDWHRQTTGSGKEDVSQADELRESGMQQRALSEVQNATARETQHGSSTTNSDSDTSEAGVGGAMSLFAGSASASHTRSTATAISFQDSRRDVSAEENQRVHQTTEQQASAARTRRASIVKEVSEAEGETLTTRVVANYNHMHAMSVLYFEVIEVFAVETRAVAAEKCLFLPMQVLGAGELLAQYRSVVIDAAEEAGMLGLVQAIREDEAGGEESTSGPTAAEIQKDLSTTSQLLRRARDQREAARDRGRKLEGEINSRSRAIAAAQAQIDQAKSQFPEGIVRQLASEVFDQVMKPAQQAMAQANGEVRELKQELETVVTQHRAAEQEIAEQTARENEHKSLLDLRREADDAASDLHRRIDRDGLFFNQVVWLKTLNPASVSALLRGKTYKGESLLSTIEPQPVAVTGNYVGFVWRPEASSGQELSDSQESQEPAFSFVSMPTGGVFAEAVLGQAISAEKIDLTRFWKWQDSPIPILPTEINPLTAGSRARDLNLTPGQLQEPAVQLRDQAPLPDPTGLAAILKTASKGEMFRNLSGLDQAKELAMDAAKHSAEGAQDAAKHASENFKEYMDMVKTVAPLVIDGMTGGEAGAASGAASMMGGMINEKAKGDGSAEAGAGALDDLGF